jgi:colicin import membrane protein
MNRLFLLPVLGIVAACVTAPDSRADLIAVFHGQVTSCYILPTEAKGLEPVVVELRVKPDGALDGEPRIVEGPPKSIAAAAALRALKKCSPFKIPSSIAPRYQDWKLMRIGFKTQS